MDRDFIQGRIDATKSQITACEDAALALASGNIQSYTFDTGQTIQKVTKLDLAALQKTIDALYNRCVTLEARLNGSGSQIACPGW